MTKYSGEIVTVNKSLNRKCDLYKKSIKLSCNIALSVNREISNLGDSRWVLVGTSVCKVVVLQEYSIPLAELLSN